MQKIWIVTVVDHGETCDGKARVLGVFKNLDEAKNYVDEDIKEWVDDHAGDSVSCSFSKMYVWLVGGNEGCEWNIEEAEV